MDDQQPDLRDFYPELDIVVSVDGAEFVATSPHTDEVVRHTSPDEANNILANKLMTRFHGGEYDGQTL